MALSVVMTSGNDEKIKKAVEEGAFMEVNYRDTNWPDKLKNSLRRREIDLILGSNGGPGFVHLTKLIRPGGRIIFFGATRGNPSEINLRQIFWKQIIPQRTTMGTAKDFSEMIHYLKYNRSERRLIRPII